MNIKDLRYGMTKISMQAKVESVEPPRSINKKDGSTGQVATALLSDSTGSIELQLWDNEVNKVKAGDNVHFENAYVNTYKGQNRLAVGKFGKLTVVGGQVPTPKVNELTEERVREIAREEFKKLLTPEIRTA